MLTIHRSKNVHDLAESLRAAYKNNPPENVLEPEYIVVQNHGMARWISLYLAKKEGIAANLEFKFPAELYWTILRVMAHDIPENLASERLPMTWAIFHILRNDTDDSLSVLHQYAAHSDAQKSEMRRWKLACRIGEVYDQYLTYRPQMLLSWEKRELLTGNSSERWQSILWRKLTNYWNLGDGAGWNHRAALQKKLHEKLAEQALPKEELPLRISIFAVSEMPPVYLETFMKVSACTDVHLYTVDVVENEQNVLIESLGEVGREFKSLVDHILEENQKIEYEHALPDKSSKPAQDSLFNVLKKDLLHAERPEEPVQYDESVQVHSCHSTHREVEVLYDQLLKMLDEDDALNPPDILVLCPQMEDYAPEIDAIFGAVEEEMPKIPYHLSERSGRHAVELGFIKLLNLADSRFKVTDVLDLLDSEPIRAAFSFSQDDINTLEKWIEDNRIRWGINGQQKQALGLPTSDSYSWQAGLHRMMSGYAMQTEKDALFGGIYPYEEIQQNEHADLLGRFSRLLHALFQCHEAVKNDRNPAKWSDLFNQWISPFFTEDEPFFRQVQNLRKTIADVAGQAKQAGFTGNVSFRIARAHTEDMIEQKRTGGGRSGRGVTFSSLVPMRNIPAQVICLIGMNDEVFPRAKSAIEFDLIAQNTERGDRVAGKDDRQLFLETIMSADEKIYFSYVGQSNRKEVEFPPSVILRELIDYVVDEYKISINEIIQHHRLHSFSTSYFKNLQGSELFSYSVKNWGIAQQLLEGETKDAAFLESQLPVTDDSFQTLSINDLIAFFQHPARFLLEQRLGIYLREDNILDEDREVFSLNGLQRYQVGQELFDRFLNDQSLDKYKNAATARDLLPEGWPGDQAFAQQRAGVEIFAPAIQQLKNQQKLDAVEIDATIGDFRVIGKLEQVYENGQLLYRFGKMRPKDLLDLWIRHLLLQQVEESNMPKTSALYTFENGKEIGEIHLPPIENAGLLLQKLLDIYERGLQEKVLFFPETSYAFVDALVNKKKNREQALRAAQNKWRNNWGHVNEGDDPYNKYLMNDVNPLEESELKKQFEQVSKQILQSLFRILNEIKETE